MQIPGVDGLFQALQFHIHTSSEHTIDGKNFGAEMHILHKDAAEDRFAVLAFMLEPSAAENNDRFEMLLEEWTGFAAKTEIVCAKADLPLNLSALVKRSAVQEFNVYDFVDGDNFFQYDAGLATPPCGDVVWWNLAEKPVSISVAQFSQLTALTVNFRSLATCLQATNANEAGSTSRDVQPLNGRTVQKICPANSRDFDEQGIVDAGDPDGVQEGEDEGDVGEGNDADEASSATNTTAAVTGAASLLAVVVAGLFL